MAATPPNVNPTPAPVDPPAAPAIDRHEGGRADVGAGDPGGGGGRGDIAEGEGFNLLGTLADFLGVTDWRTLFLELLGTVALVALGVVLAGLAAWRLLAPARRQAAKAVEAVT